MIKRAESLWEGTWLSYAVTLKVWFPNAPHNDADTETTPVNGLRTKSPGLPPVCTILYQVIAYLLLSASWALTCSCAVIVLSETLKKNVRAGKSGGELLVSIICR